MRTYDYQITQSEPDQIVVESVVVNIKEQRYETNIRFRFGITDLGGGSWGSYTFLFRHTPVIGANYLPAIKSSYSKFNAIFNANEAYLDQARAWAGLVINP